MYNFLNKISKVRWVLGYKNLREVEVCSMNVHSLGIQEHKQAIRKMLIYEGRDLE